ncbi:hypothetical protein D3C86_1189400 [compost metagenome]
MTLGYDPERHLLSVNLQNGLPEFTLRVDEVVFKYYAEGVILSAGITDRGIDVRVWPTPEAPSAITLVPAGDGRWEVRIVLRI